MAELYEVFNRIFLKAGRIESTCGHTILIFDHHFFHMAAVEAEGKKRLFMADEREAILSTREGFGEFKVLHGGSRARNLASAYATMAEPDEVWVKNPKTNSRWVYIKQFASVPDAFTVALVTYRSDEKIIVPVSSFPCRQKDIKKWRLGERMH